MRVLLPIAFLLLTACSGGMTTGGGSDDGIVRMALGPTGLVDTVSGQEISFGRAEAGAISSATALLGRRPDVVTERRCPGGPVGLAVWRDTVEMQFRAGSFVGWRAVRSALPRTQPLTPTTAAAGQTC